MNLKPKIHSKPKMRRTDIFITELQYELIMKKSKEKGITFSEMFRKVVDWYIEEKCEK